MAKPQIFLDANVLIAAGKPPGGPELSRLSGLVDADFVTFLTTDLTITEVSKKHADNDFQLIKPLADTHFRKKVEDLTETKLPAIDHAHLRGELTKTYLASTNAMFKSLGAKILPIDEVKPSTVFNAYSAGVGFFTGNAKKNQFPDAFIFECLKAVASEAQPIIVVSKDKDFTIPVEEEQNIEKVASLPELFTRLGLETEAPQIGPYLEAHHADFVAAVDHELAMWGLIGDIENSEIYDPIVLNVVPSDLIAFKFAEPDDSILVVGNLTATVKISFDHPDWDGATYDSEDKVLIPHADVSGETELKLEIDFSLSLVFDKDGQFSSIEDLRFRNDKFQYVELHPFDWDDYR